MKYKVGDKVKDQDGHVGTVVVIDDLIVVEFDRGGFSDYDLDGTADDSDEGEDALSIRLVTKLDKALR